MKADSCFEFEGDNTLKYLGEEKDNVLEVALGIRFGENPSEDERYFYIEINCEDEKEIDKFAELSDKIKSNLKKIDFESVRINTLWDDIGRHYAMQAYPLINEIENLMRKLISQFMLINVGMEWTNIAIHDDLKEKIQKKNESIEPLIDDLHKTDFIHLSDVLFKKYRTLDTEELNRILSGAESKSQIDFNEIKGFILKSNWERHFSNKVDSQEENLKKKWKMLYGLRNKVAHNRFLTKTDYKQILGLVNALKPIINSSLDKLEEIKLKEEEKESVISSYSSSSSFDSFNVILDVADWYREKYENVKTISSVLDIGYDIVIPLENGKCITVTVKHFMSVRPRYIKGEALRLLDFPYDGSIHGSIHERHVVFVVDGSGINDSIIHTKFDISKDVKIIVGYIRPQKGFIPISNEQ